MRRNRPEHGFEGLPQKDDRAVLDDRSLDLDHVAAEVTASDVHQLRSAVASVNKLATRLKAELFIDQGGRLGAELTQKITI